MKPCLLDLMPASLPVPSQGQAYRRKQLAEWLYHHGAVDFDSMLNLPRSWRLSLAEQYQILPFYQVERFPSEDKSVRYLFTLLDNKQTEAVFMPYQNRNTVCLSSMVGCPAGCAFCATGAMGFGRNLSQAEMIGQLLAIAAAERISPREIRNVVLMGMGEALLNYENALSAIKLMVLPEALDMSLRRITLSTVGLPKHIRRLADDGVFPVLAVSLHAPDEETRKKIIPTAHAHSIDEIIAALHYWQDQGGRRVTIEYTMLKGVNDALWQAKMLSERVKGLLVHINLIPFNPWPTSGFEASERQRLLSFSQSLEQAGLSVSIRFSRGRDAGAACGQLALTQTLGDQSITLPS